VLITHTHDPRAAGPFTLTGGHCTDQTPPRHGRGWILATTVITDPARPPLALEPARFPPG